MSPETRKETARKGSGGDQDGRRARMAEALRESVEDAHRRTAEEATPRRMAGQHALMPLGRGLTHERLAIGDRGQGDTPSKVEERVTLVPLSGDRRTGHAGRIRGRVEPEHGGPEAIPRPGMHLSLDHGTGQVRPREGGVLGETAPGVAFEGRATVPP